MRLDNRDYFSRIFENKDCRPYTFRSVLYCLMICLVCLIMSTQQIEQTLDFTEKTKSDDKSVEIENAPAKYKSHVWGHFGFAVRYEENGRRTVDSQITVCKHCYQALKYTGNTTNMSDHINRYHPQTEIKRPCTNTRPLNMTFVSVADEETNKDPLPIVGQLKMQTFTQLSLSASCKRAIAITKSIALFMVFDMRPLCVVENPGFRNMVQTLEPRYVLPSRTYFTNNIIPELYNSTRESVKEKLQEAEFLSLTTDGWTSRKTDSHITMTVHFIDKNWNIQSFVLQTRVLNESHTSIALADLLTDCEEEWSLRRPATTIAVTTDNAKNVVNSVRDAFGFGPNIRCFAHSINLACQKGLQVTSLQRLLGKVRKLVTYFHHSAIAKEILKSKQLLLNIPDHNLIMDVSTRWNSTYDMLERYSAQHEAILLASIEIKKKHKDLQLLSDDEVNNVKAISEILKPMKTVTKMLCSEQLPTISIILPLKRKMERAMMISSALDEENRLAQDVKKAIRSDLMSRYQEPDLLMFLQEATILDPRFKGLPEDDQLLDDIYSRIVTNCLKYSKDVQNEVNDDSGANEIETMAEDRNCDNSEPKHKKTAIEELLGDVFPQINKIKSTTLYENVQKEINQFKEGPTIPLDSNPLQWWAANSTQYPNLAKQAKKYLGIPGTSVPSERVFSTAGDIVSSQRNCLHPDNVDMMIFLKKNLKYK